MRSEELNQLQSGRTGSDETDGCVDAWMCECMDVWMYGYMNV